MEWDVSVDALPAYLGYLLLQLHLYLTYSILRFTGACQQYEER